MNHHAILHRAFALILASLCTGVTTHAQEGDTGYWSGLRLGPQAAYEVVHQIADFSSLPGIPGCCPRYSSGSADGFRAGAVLRLPVNVAAGGTIGLSVGVREGVLEARESELGSDRGTPIPITIRHAIDARFLHLTLNLGAYHRLIGRLAITGGVSLSLLLDSRYSQQETIVEPVDHGVFSDTQTRSRNSLGGTIPDATRILTSLAVGLHHALPLTATWTSALEPSITVEYQPTHLVKNLEWKHLVVRAGVAITFRLSSSEVGTDERPEPMPASPED